MGGSEGMGSTENEKADLWPRVRVVWAVTVLYSLSVGEYGRTRRSTSSASGEFGERGKLARIPGERGE